MTMKLQHVLLLALCVSTFLGGGEYARASEVTGTLSSNAQAVTTSNSGSLSGTVTSATSGGGGGSGGSHSSSGGSASSGGLATTQPAGQVLGAATSNIPSPAFPNAGEPVDLGDGATWFVLVLGGLALALLMLIRSMVRIV
jgi:hypothetical protein